MAILIFFRAVCKLFLMGWWRVIFEGDLDEFLEGDFARFREAGAGL